MKRNELTHLEKMLAQVQLRQPELDVETLLRQAAEPEGTVTRRGQVGQVRRKRCFCRWATLTGIWTSGLVVGILITYLYVGNSLQTARAELNSLAQELKLAQATTQPPQKPETVPHAVPSSIHPNKTSPPQENYPPQRHDFLACLDRLDATDSPITLRAGRLLSQRPCPYPKPHRQFKEVPDEEPSSTLETKPYKPKPAKTRHQLFQEVLKDLNV